MIPFELDIKDHQEISIAWNYAHFLLGGSKNFSLGWKVIKILIIDV